MKIYICGENSLRVERAILNNLIHKKTQKESEERLEELIREGILSMSAEVYEVEIEVREVGK